MGKLYDEKSIESLDPLEFTRLKPGVYCGSTEYSTQLLVEIISNVIDEFNLGHGNKVEVVIDKDIVTVKDYGQGFIPNSFREDKKSILEAAFSVLNTSGKYREDGTYEGTSLGSFGIGAKLPTFLSHWLEVTTFRDNQYEKIYFKEGKFDKRESGKVNSQQTGTIVKWQPSEEFFTHTEVELNKIIELFDTIVCLCQGFSIILNINGKEQIFTSQYGLSDLVDKAVGNKEIINNRFNINYQEGKYKINMVLTYTSNYSSTIVPYVNTGLTESGLHITQIKTIITREFNKFFRDKKWIKDKEDNLSGEDIQEGMYVAFNITAPNVAYDAQVKSRITKLDMKPFTQVIADELQNWLNTNEKEIKTIADKAINARKARDAAKKAREAVRENKKAKKKKIINPDKLKDAERLGQDSILLCVEGLSAASSMAVARDINRYGILALRGKPLNLFTNSVDRINKNEEIQLLINALGIDLANYNSSQLRYGRVAIASDSDSDGYHIGLLIAVALEYLCPQFLEEGRLCWLRSPLYIVKEGKKESYYYSDEELAKANINTKNKIVQRNKGLGSLSAEQAHNSMFTEEFQRLDVLQSTPEAIQLLRDLMGNSAVKRKDFIFKNVDFSEVRE